MNQRNHPFLIYLLAIWLCLFGGIAVAQSNLKVRKIIFSGTDAFPEKELFTHRIGGMRSFADMLMELLGIAGPGIMEIVNGVPTQLNEHFEHGNQKSAILAKWDETTEVLDAYMPQIGRDRYHDKIKAFGQYEGTVLSTILYYIDNEIHHRA